MNRSDQDIIAESLVELLLEEADPYHLVKAHGNRWLAMHGTKVGSVIGTIEHIPHVDMHTLESDPSKDRYFAYVHSPQSGAHGVTHMVTQRLGAYDSKESASDAIKSHHQLKAQK